MLFYSSARPARRVAGHRASSVMRPTFPPPNPFELAILRHLATKLPALNDIIPQIRVRERSFSPCGSFTELECAGTVEVARSPIGMSLAIEVPGVPYGMDGLLFFKDGRPDLLEIVACGGESWDGTYDGFTIPPAA